MAADAPIPFENAPLASNTPVLFVVQVATGDATLVVLNPWGRALSGFDQLPEFRILLERLVLLHLQSGAEEKVLEGMAVEDAMHDQAQLVAFEIDAVIPYPEPVQGSAGALELP